MDKQGTRSLSSSSKWLDGDIDDNELGGGCGIRVWSEPGDLFHFGLDASYPLSEAHIHMHRHNLVLGCIGPDAGESDELATEARFAFSD